MIKIITNYDKVTVSIANKKGKNNPVIGRGGP
jgi:hypothetical protein